ncbi:MAG: OmpA family protein [Cytophagales bacterium]
MKYKLLKISIFTFLVLCVVSCNTAAKYTKKGDKKFKLGEYDFALQNYQTALKKSGGNKTYLNFKAGESLRLSNRLTEAVPNYEKAIALNPKLDTAKFYYAYGLKHQGNYEQAIVRLKEYVADGKNYEYKLKAQKELDNLSQWETIYKKQTGYKIKNASYLNTPEAEYGVTTYNENTIYFASSRNMSKLYRATQTGFLDLFKYVYDGFSANSGTATPLPKPIYDTETHEASPTFSPDGTMMIFAKSNDGSKKGRKECDLYVSYYRAGLWSEPKLLNINTKDSWTSTPMLSPDGRTLYFSSNRKGGQGGIDLYKSSWNDTTWSTPVNLGSKINTIGNELFPFLSPSGKFYFASDGQAGLGGLDIFKAVRDSSTGSLTVENIGQPVNSQYDDFAISFNTDSTGYFSSNREGGKGDDDIYEFKYKPLYIVNFSLEGLVNTIKDTLLAGIDSAKVKIYKGDSLVLDSLTNNDGLFFSKLQEETDYKIVATKNNFYTNEIQFTTKGKRPKNKDLKEGVNEIVLKTTITLEPIQLNINIVIENIYYDYRKSDIRTDAALELDKIVKLLNDNPGIYIELSSHTDSRGNDDMNLKLSQSRADAAVAYIISKGIDKNRITAKGYGETKPIIIEEKSEEDYQKNRRTEFKVTKVIQLQD